MLAPLLSLARVVPIWAWALAAVLAWGGWQRHQATASAAELQAQQAAIAQQREQALQASIHETQRRLTAQQGITDEAQTRARRAGVDAAAARVAADRLRAHLAGLAASAAAGPPGAADRGEADQLADLLGRCAERYQHVAGVADAAIIAGSACERSYRALTP